MKTKFLGLALAVAAVSLPATTFAAPDDNVKRIIRGSVDGDRTFYTVTCRDGGRASMYVVHETETTCALPRNGTPQCARDAALSDVAAKACKAPKRG